VATAVTLGRFFDQRRVAATAGGRAVKFFAEDDEFGYNGFELNGGISSDTYSNGPAMAAIGSRISAMTVTIPCSERIARIWSTAPPSA